MSATFFLYQHAYFAMCRYHIEIPQRNPIFSCDVEPIELDWQDVLSHKYVVNVDASFTEFMHTVNACLFMSSKIYDSKGNTHELRNLLHHSNVGYDW